jgi:hypothetical protein
MRRGRQGNPLRAYFEGGPERLLHKWVHYFDIYHRHLAPYRGRHLTVVEFGVQQDGRKPVGRRQKVQRVAPPGSMVITA